MRGQIKFLEELDKAEQKRHEEQEREMLMRAAKSRSKTEDPEQAKLKAKVVIRLPRRRGRFRCCFLFVSLSFFSPRFHFVLGKGNATGRNGGIEAKRC